MGDHVVRLTESQESTLEELRLQGTFARILSDEGGVSELPDPVTADEFVQTIVEKYLDAKESLLSRRVIKDLDATERELILAHRAAENPPIDP